MFIPARIQEQLLAGRLVQVPIGRLSDVASYRKLQWGVEALPYPLRSACGCPDRARTTL